MWRPAHGGTDRPGHPRPASGYGRLPGRPGPGALAWCEAGEPGEAVEPGPGADWFGEPAGAEAPLTQSTQ